MRLFLPAIAFASVIFSNSEGKAQIPAVPPTQTKPQSQSRGVTVWGTADCKEFLQLASEGRSGELSVMLHVRWMFGYLTALNVHRNPGKDALVKIDAPLVRDWTVRHCKANLADNTGDAATALFERLSK